MLRPVLFLVVSTTLAAGVLFTGPAPAARAEATSVTIAGSLQSELGCTRLVDAGRVDAAAVR